MSTSELADLEAVLYGLLPDPKGFADRVLQQLQERLTAQPQAPETAAAEDPEVYDGLVHRNLLLASALGACECWGEDAGCATCAGEGNAGWIEPDRHLYRELVVPATRRLAARKRPPSPQSSDQSDLKEEFR